MTTMNVESSAFSDGTPIPAEYATEAAGGRNVSPQLSWSGVPEAAKSIAVEVVDLHPAAKEWVHWLVVDIPPEITSLPKGASGSAMPDGSIELVNSFETPGWGGPEPARASGRHWYRFRVLALDVPALNLYDFASLADFRATAAKHVIASGSITGTFER